MIRFGYACKVLGVPQTNIRSCILKNASPSNLLEISRHNLAALQRMVEYTRAQQIGLFRLSSDVIPLASHPDIQFDWQNLCGPELEALGQSIEGHSIEGQGIERQGIEGQKANPVNKNNAAHQKTKAQELASQNNSIRVSMHPGQYTVLNSPHPEVVERAMADLLFHAQFLDALGVDESAKIILHVGGVYSDKSLALERFKASFKKLPECVVRRLVLENDEHCYAIDEVLNLCETLQVPAIFDVFHHSILAPKEGSYLDWLQQSAKTWKDKDGRQKIHYSQQLPKAKPGSHSHSIETEPFLSFYQQIQNFDLDIMLEVKDKNLSAIKCKNLCTQNLPRRALTDEWARYKYTVLEKSPSHYQQFRNYLKADKPEALQFYQLLEQALAQPVSPGNALNAAQHVWGYLDELATPADKKKVLQSFEMLKDSLQPLAGLKKKFYTLAEQQKQLYLLQSLYFYPV